MALLRAACLAALALATMPASAQAQSADWVLNLNDTGYDPTAAGGSVVYSVTVENNGLGAAPATTIVFDVPAQTVLTAATFNGCAPVPPVWGRALVTCTVPPLAGYGGVTGSVTLRTTRAGDITLSAVVSDPGGIDTVPENNDDAKRTTVTAGSDIALDVSGPVTAASGSTVDYVLSVTNLGPDPADSVMLEFPAPPELSNITVPAGCVLSGAVYRCAVAGPVAGGGTVTRTIRGQITTAAGSTLTVAGSVVGAVPADPVSGDNTETLNTAVTAGSDLAVAKARPLAGPLVVGDPVTFTLTPRYTGNVPTAIVVSGPRQLRD